MNPDWLNAILGGLLIGAAVSIMLLFNGRVTGVSGIMSGLLGPVAGDVAWRLAFLGGLVVGGVLLSLIKPGVFGSGELSAGWPTVIAGLLVGFGTALGSGCTSGHGVCGVSRLSMRSVAATVLFIAAGAATVFAIRNFGGMP